MTEHPTTPTLTHLDPRTVCREGRPEALGGKHFNNRLNTTQPLGRLMRGRNLMVRDVEAATGISHRTLSDYLAGRREIRPQHLATLADAFGVDTAYLTGQGHHLEPTPTPTFPAASELLGAFGLTGDPR